MFLLFVAAAVCWANGLPSLKPLASTSRHAAQRSTLATPGRPATWHALQQRKQRRQKRPRERPASQQGQAQLQRAQMTHLQAAAALPAISARRALLLVLLLLAALRTWALLLLEVQVQGQAVVVEAEEGGCRHRCRLGRRI